MRLRTSISIVAVSASLSALAAPPSDAQARYQTERATCNGGQSYQDRTTCLKEAGAAYEEAKRGRLDDGRAQYQQNALARCEVLPAEDRIACQARMQGQGTTRGSVEGGGIYRELITREVPAEGGAPPDAGARSDRAQ